MGKPGFPIPLLEGFALPHPPAGGEVGKSGFPTSPTGTQQAAQRNHCGKAGGILPGPGYYYFWVINP